MRGSGWHRCVYVLFEHDGPIDVASEFASKSASSSSSPFPARSFNMSEFYVRHQEAITPVGLAFFQSEWDMSVKRVFHSHFSELFTRIRFSYY